jgi:hypothetical protein
MQVVLVMTALFFGAVGVYFSATTRRTLRANMLTYFIIMLFIVMPFIAVFIVIPLQLNSNGEDLPTLLFLGGMASINPVLTMAFSQSLMQDQQALFMFEARLDNGTQMVFPMPWLVLSVIYLVLTAIVMFVTIRKLKRIADE